jgi:hypothetical protein
MCNLANVMFDEGQFEEPPKLHKQTIPIKRRVHGPTDKEALRSNDALA